MIETIPGCTELCPLENFFAIVKDVLPSDDEYHCHPTENIKMSSNSEQVYTSGSSLAVGKTSYYVISSLFLTISILRNAIVNVYH